MNDLRVDIATIIRESLGENPAIEKVVDLLYRGGSLTDKTLRSHVVREQFHKLMLKDRERSARDIEEELSVRYDVGVTTVRYYRNSYLRQGARKKCKPHKVK